MCACQVGVLAVQTGLESGQSVHFVVDYLSSAGWYGVSGLPASTVWFRADGGNRQRIGSDTGPSLVHVQQAGSEAGRMGFLRNRLILMGTFPLMDLERRSGW